MSIRFEKVFIFTKTLIFTKTYVYTQIQSASIYQAGTVIPEAGHTGADNDGAGGASYISVDSQGLR